MHFVLKVVTKSCILFTFLSSFTLLTLFLTPPLPLLKDFTPHQVRNEFHVTEKMSTYLVAFVICDFKTKQEFTKTNNITVKVAVAEDKLEQADFALKTATNITEYYEHYFGIKYPLPKQGKPIEVIFHHTF